MKRIVLLPPPRRVAWQMGSYAWRGSLRVVPDAALAALPLPEGMAWAEVGSGDVRFVHEAQLAPEACRLTVAEGGVTIAYGTPSGAYYALMTLAQIMPQSDGALPHCAIEDAPALPLRGVMLDISRDKVPTLQTLLSLVDKLALMKINHVQLYMEGFSYAYDFAKDLWVGETPITAEELQALDAYCRARFIDLVPSQNSLGHMGAWLATERYNPLAEVPGGATVMGRTFPPNTMDPADPGSLALVTQMTDELLPNFTSGLFHVNMDEPFELGQGKSKAAVAQYGRGKVYLDYARKVHAMVAARGKRMMMWGDVVANHPEAIGDVPQDVIIVEWGYEAEHPFDVRTARLRDAGLDFCLCPGTSSWSSYTGITDNMLANIGAAGKAAHAYGAMGLIVADWGDGGHQQYLPISYAGIAYGAAHAWHADGIPEDALAGWLSRMIFRDETGTMGQLALDAGRYRAFEEFIAPCRMVASFTMMLGIVPPAVYPALMDRLIHALYGMMAPELRPLYLRRYEERGPLDLPGLLAYMDAIQKRLAKAAMQAPDADIIRREYRNAIRLVCLLEIVRNATVENDFARAADWQAEMAAIRQEHEVLWRARNKEGGLSRSVRPLLAIEAALGEKAK